MIDKRKCIRNRNEEECRRLNKQIIKKCMEAKTKWLKEKCEEIKELQKRNNTREMHAQIKSMMKQQKKKGAQLKTNSSAARRGSTLG